MAGAPAARQWLNSFGKFEAGGHEHAAQRFFSLKHTVVGVFGGLDEGVAAWAQLYIVMVKGETWCNRFHMSRYASAGGAIPPAVPYRRRCQPVLASPTRLQRVGNPVHQ